MPPKTPLPDRLRFALNWLEQHSTQKDRDNLKRFGITATKFFGISMANMKVLARELGRDRELAAALWKSGWYEARMLACLLDEPAKVTPVQMDRWCRDFDNWAICDTACFHLFDRTPHAFTKIAKWASHKDEFVKRAAFALLASVALHDKKAADEPFLDCMHLMEAAATDERNFVKKGVVWALRGVGGRNAVLFKVVSALCEKLIDTKDSTARWVGRTALREIKKRAAR